MPTGRGAVQEGWLQAAREAWPDIRLEPTVFAAHLARHSAPDERDGGPSFVHAADLYLACACAYGVKEAIAAFDRTLGEDVARAVRRVDGSPAFADEVAQVVRAKLLVGDAPKIAEYAGRSSLRGWVSTVATRAALNLRRNADDRGHDPIDSQVRGIADDQDGEISYMKRRYGLEFDAALQLALGRLDSGHRALLRLHFSERLSLERIAAVYHVSRATIVRRMAAARRALLDDMDSTLRSKLRLSESELESLRSFVVSAMNLSIARLLESSR
jgi:RNA polymerase sigma-70 factor (ECF subfamily)